MEREIKVGQKWKHFKGAEVEIVSLALDSENLSEVVVYKHFEAQKGMPAGQVWVRDKKMFLETINRDGKEIERFSLVQ